MGRFFDLRAFALVIAFSGLAGSVFLAARQTAEAAKSVAPAPRAAAAGAARPAGRPSEERRLLGGGVAAAITVVREEKPPPAFEVARVLPGKQVELRSRPRGPVVTTLDAATEFGSPQTLGVVRRRGKWLGVVSTALPNGRIGWVRKSEALEVSSARVSLVLDLSRRELRLRQGRRVLRRMSVGIGRAGSPTPIGRFAVTDKLPGSRYGSFYGCCILALSAHQPNLPPGWPGGDRIAVHGTNDPGSIGRASSAGCPHASDADMRVLFRRVPLGAPVFVHA